MDAKLQAAVSAAAWERTLAEAASLRETAIVEPFDAMSLWREAPDGTQRLMAHTRAQGFQYVFDFIKGTADPNAPAVSNKGKMARGFWLTDGVFGRSGSAEGEEWA